MVLITTTTHHPSVLSYFFTMTKKKVGPCPLVITLPLSCQFSFLLNGLLFFRIFIFNTFFVVLFLAYLQLRIMEQQLAESPWGTLSDSTPTTPTTPAVKEREVIHRLEGQVDEQRKMRLNDARQVEAKAAKIKEWVTNKLREVTHNFILFVFFCLKTQLSVDSTLTYRKSISERRNWKCRNNTNAILLHPRPAQGPHRGDIRVGKWNDNIPFVIT